jgi:hypothetical protein
MKECSVSTTARRTVGIVCRKNGKSLGARSLSGNLGMKLGNQNQGASTGAWDSRNRVIAQDVDYFLVGDEFS